MPTMGMIVVIMRGRVCYCCIRRCQTCDSSVDLRTLDAVAFWHQSSMHLSLIGCWDGQQGGNVEPAPPNGPRVLHVAVKVAICHFAPPTSQRQHKGHLTTTSHNTDSTASHRPKHPSPWTALTTWTPMQASAHIQKHHRECKARKFGRPRSHKQRGAYPLSLADSHFLVVHRRSADGRLRSAGK
jgi:hypothetical protein